jgi:GNAT superfamily N-acetyltransferase
MNDELRIRPAQQDDLESLLDLYHHLNEQDARCPPEEAVAVFERFLLYRGNVIMIGFIEGEMVASCTVVIIPNLTRGGMPYALIENVVTQAGYRNRGFGKAILKAAVERAWGEGCYKAMLLAGSNKASTIAFYEEAGFEQTKTGFQIRRLPVRAE